jgi:hypothetical protein
LDPIIEKLIIPGAVVEVGKYFEWTVTDGKLCFNIKREMIEKAEDLDGCYVIRTLCSN